DPAASVKAGMIYDLERRIAESHVSRADSEDVHKANNPWATSAFAKSAPGMGWPAFFEGTGIEGQRTIMVWHPSGTIGISALVASQPLEVWKAYLKFHTLDHNLYVLPKPFRDEAFAFYGRTLSGAQAPRERWKRAVDATNAA